MLAVGRLALRTECLFPDRRSLKRAECEPAGDASGRTGVRKPPFHREREIGFRDGAPAPPKQHPALEWLAAAVHVGLYADLILGALVGLVAYFWLPGLGEPLMMRQILIVLFALHFIGALWHRFVLRDEGMTRMIRPAR